MFEQLHVHEFSFHLIITPFRDGKLKIEKNYRNFKFIIIIIALSTPDYGQFDGGGGGSSCDHDREYRCRNERCIAIYLTCDHHNNCGDHSDEATNCLSKVPTTSSTLPSPPASSPHPLPTPYPPPSPTDFDYPIGRPEVPTFDIDGNRIEPPPRGGVIPDSGIPEYVDVPFPTDYPPYYPQTTTRRNFYFDTMNGVGGTATSSAGGGFLEDLFTFSSNGKVSNVVYVVRYLLAVLVIIVLVTLVNFLIWCLITKRDQSFMAPAASPTLTQRPMPNPLPATSTLSVISDV